VDTWDGADDIRWMKRYTINYNYTLNDCQTSEEGGARTGKGYLWKLHILNAGRGGVKKKEKCKGNTLKKTVITSGCSIPRWEMETKAYKESVSERGLPKNCWKGKITGGGKRMGRARWNLSIRKKK